MTLSRRFAIGAVLLVAVVAGGFAASEHVAPDRTPAARDGSPVPTWWN
ncbi:hypothetical protein ACFQJD_08620 [Haloplanus sp. GCM10025708]